MSYLFLALSPKGFGETILGRRVAQELWDSGRQSAFLVHSSSALALADSPFEFTVVHDGIGPLFLAYLDDMVRRHRSSRIILADYFTTDLFLSHNGLEGEILFNRYGIPITAIDTWCASICGLEMDIYWRKTRRIRDWLGTIEQLVQPAPLADRQVGKSTYSALPEAIRQKATIGARLTAKKTILIVTAEWQQTTYQCHHADRIAYLVPELLAEYVGRLGTNVDVIHVGTRPFHVGLGSNYKWLPPQPPDKFREVLDGSDIFLSLNISATTISLALQLEIPVVVITNDYEISSRDAIKSLPFLTTRAAAWLARAVPLYPFYLWPVGFHNFLKPLVASGRFMSAISHVQLLDEAAVLMTLDALLNSSSARDDALNRQLAYRRTLAILPSVADLIPV